MLQIDPKPIMNEVEPKAYKKIVRHLCNACKEQDIKLNRDRLGELKIAICTVDFYAAMGENLKSGRSGITKSRLKKYLRDSAKKIEKLRTEIIEEFPYPYIEEDSLHPEWTDSITSQFEQLQKIQVSIESYERWLDKNEAINSAELKPRITYISRLMDIYEEFTGQKPKTSANHETDFYKFVLAYFCNIDFENHKIFHDDRYLTISVDTLHKEVRPLHNACLIFTLVMDQLYLPAYLAVFLFLGLGFEVFA